MSRRPAQSYKNLKDDQRRQRRLIRRVVVSRTTVRSGESISVIVRTFTGPDSQEPMVRIQGAAGSHQFVQLSGPRGRRTLNVTAVSGRLVDTHKFHIEVVDADPCAKIPVLDVRGDPSREATGVWSIRNAEEIHRPGAYYEWHYGGQTPTITRIPQATIGYADLFSPNERFRVFHTRLVVRYPDQSLRTAKRSVTIWNRYALAKERGLVQPRVAYHFRAAPEGNQLVGKARIENHDDEFIRFTQQYVQWLLNVPDAPASPERPTKIDITLGPREHVDIEHGVRLDAFPANAFGFAVILCGETRSRLKAHAAAYFEHHTPRINGVRVIEEAKLAAMIQSLREEECDQSKRRFTRADLEALARRREERGEAGLVAQLGRLFARGMQAMSGSFEGQECLPDQMPPEEGLVCQLTDEWGWIAVPGRFVNARKGDVLLSPGSGGPIMGVLRHVNPPQIYSHSAIMINNYYTLRHSTASEAWLQDHTSDSFTEAGSDGLDPEALKYIWPGTITQSAENAMHGELFDDPDEKKDEYGAVKQYTLSAMTNGGLDLGNEIVDPLVVKPHPAEEVGKDWVRANLHRVADAAKAINGHYRFFAYTDAKICGEATGEFLAPMRSGWWASGTRPTVCSAMIWAAAASLREPVVRLEGPGPFTQSSDIEPSDKGGDVDFMTRDGLYKYDEQERRVAAQWLYNYFYNVAYQIAGAGGVFLTDAADDLANQICNTFAFDWTGWSDVYDDESKDSERWKNPGEGRAVSPDNIRDNWDKPTSFDGKIVHGLYGFSEPLIYRQPYLEYRRISRWKRVSTRGNLLGDVRYKGGVVGGAIVNIGGNSLLSDPDGSFRIELPAGPYHVQAGKLINAGYAEGDANVTVIAGQDAHVTVDLKDPPELCRRLTIRGTMKIEDYENFGDNEHATRNKVKHSDLGPYGTHDEFQWIEKMGGEIRVEVVLKIDWKIDLSIAIAWNVKLYEGTSEETSDLDGERSGTFKVDKDETKTLKFSVWNTDEDEPQDRADITFELTNSVRP